MKKRYFLILLFIMIFFNYNVVNAIPATEEFGSKMVTQCNIGTTNGAVFANKWGFVIQKGCSQSEMLPSSNVKNCKKDTFYWSFYYTHAQICGSDGCKGDYWSTSQSNFPKGSVNLNSLFSNPAFYNIYSNGNENIKGVYSNSGLQSLLERGNCPAYVYLGSSKSKKKIGFIFSSEKIDNADELLKNAGFTVEFTQEGGENLTDLALKNYNDHLNMMKDYIKEFKDNNYSEVYSDNCKRGTLVGENADDVKKFQKYREELRLVRPNFDFSEGDLVVKEFGTLECAEIPDSNSDDINSGTVVTGCEVIPEVVRKWINNILNFVRYVALALVIALGALDFMKAAGSGEPDAMKKAGQSFMKRMIAVVILFLLPVLVDFILNMINIYGVDPNNVDCL